MGRRLVSPPASISGGQLRFVHRGFETLPVERPVDTFESGFSAGLDGSGGVPARELVTSDIGGHGSTVVDTLPFRRLVVDPVSLLPPRPTIAVEGDQAKRPFVGAVLADDTLPSQKFFRKPEIKDTVWRLTVRTRSKLVLRNRSTARLRLVTGLCQTRHK